jgi:hypothetical protein
MGMTTEHDPDEAPLSPSESNAAASYHRAPTNVPRALMWEAIQARRAQQNHVPAHAPPLTASATAQVVVTHTTRRSLSRLLPRGLLAIATAAVIVIVVGVARRAPATPESPDTSTTAGTSSAAPATSAVGDAWQVASSEHFGVAETMLTTLGASTDAQSDRQLTAWSRDLLESTRLLMDSPAGRDAKRRVLLQDLELVLVQLVESGPNLRTEDRSVMDELLSRSALLLTRIRTTVPAGVPASNH